MLPTEIVKLSSLMERTSGNPEIKIGLVDGPVVTQHTDLTAEHLRQITGNNGACTQANAVALLWSEFPAATAAQIKLALIRASAPRRAVVPPLLNAEAAYQILFTANVRR